MAEEGAGPERERDEREQREDLDAAPDDAATHASWFTWEKVASC